MFQEISSHIQQNYKDEYEHVPKKEHLISWVNELLSVLFPLQEPNENETNLKLELNKNHFLSLLNDARIEAKRAQELTAIFYNNLFKIHKELLQDAQEVYNNDPAAKCLGEIIHTYPGFYAVSIYRISHLIHSKLKIQYVPRMLSEYAHGKTGIDIHPGAQIQAPVFIDHGTGVVIGETCIIGKHVNIYQGVTLGALQVEKDMENKKRHPTIEDYVVIYANATILGGSTTVGNNSVIGGNVFLTKSVDPYSLVYSKNNITVKKIDSDSKEINFVI